MAMSVVKFYQFRLKSGTQYESFLRSSQALDSLLLATKGFKYRSLARVDMDMWQDIIYWQTMNAAAEAEKLMLDERLQRYISHIDVASMFQSQAKLQSQTLPDLQAMVATEQPSQSLLEVG